MMKSYVLIVFLLMRSLTVTAQIGIDQETLDGLKGKVSLVKDSTVYVVAPTKAINFAGDTVSFLDKVMRVHVNNNRSAELLFKDVALKVYVIGNGAGNKALKLKGKLISATGTLHFFNGKPVVYINDTDKSSLYTLRVVDPVCNCLKGEPNSVMEE